MPQAKDLARIQTLIQTLIQMLVVQTLIQTLIQMRPQYSRTREELIEQLTAKFGRSIQTAQQRLLQLILNDFLRELKTDGDLVKNTIDNQITVNQLDKLFRRFMEVEGARIVKSFLRDANVLFEANVNYFSRVVDATGDAYQTAAQGVKEQVFAALGYNLRTGKAIRGGRLDTIFSDQTPINAVKLQVQNAIANSEPLLDTRARIRIVTVGDERTTASLTKHVENNMPDPFYQFDRKAGENFANTFQLNYAIYQGGLIRTSRPFCRVRNNKVFTRDEIGKFGTSADAFGGYSNKATGDFNGKITPYDPFAHLGGYNCRHQLDWISEELAFTLRPELRQQAGQLI